MEGKKKLIKIFLKGSDGKQRIVNIEPGSTLKKLIQQAQVSNTITIDSLTFKGKKIKEDDYEKKLSELELKNGSIIQIVSRLTGGKQD